MRIEVVQSDWDRLKMAWQALILQSERATVFQTFEWCHEFYKAKLQQGEPYLLEVKDGAETIGIAPLAKVGRRGQMKRLLLIGGDYNDVLSFPGREKEVVGALLDLLMKTAKEWDIADLRSLRYDSVLLDGLPKQTPLMQARIEHQNYPVRELPTTYDALLASLSKSMRTDLKQSPKKMAKNFSSVALRKADHKTLEQDMDALFALHQARWTGKGEHGIFAEPHVRDFHLRLAKGFLERDQLLLYTVWLEGKPAGAAYCLRQGNEAVYYLGGFDPSLSQYNPQKVALAAAMEDCISSGVKVLDFLKGEEDYKWRWGAQPRKTYRVILAPKKLKSWASMTGLKLQPWAKDLRRRFKKG